MWEEINVSIMPIREDKQWKLEGFFHVKFEVRCYVVIVSRSERKNIRLSIQLYKTDIAALCFPRWRMLDMINIMSKFYGFS